MFNIVQRDETRKVGNRTIVNLSGTWCIGESMEADAMATAFEHTAPVPGMLTAAQPPFEAIGEFDTSFHEYAKVNWKMCTGGVYKEEQDAEVMAQRIGVSRQPRNYFWCKRTFVAPNKQEYADLHVLKARFTSKVWLNGQVVGENINSFIEASYDVSDVIRWGEENEIVIRIGAHPGVSPEGNLDMEDCEHEKWYPGIWDDVELHCYNGVKIAAVQFATKINPKQIVIETELENKKDQAVNVTLKQEVKTPDMNSSIGICQESYEVAAGETKIVQCTIALPDAKLWTPDTPNLYILETTTDGDSELNRFGVREVGFKSSTKRFYLNGEVCFLRGGLMTLERFIEDPLSGQLPWDENWVRKLIGESRRSIGWNMTKFCLCDAPRRWLEIADEEGLMIVPELPIWCFNPNDPAGFNGYKKEYDLDILTEATKNWVRGQRAHSCIIYWSAALETVAPWMDEVIIPTGRAQDIEKRNWLNSYGTPQDPDDPLENHPYLFTTNGLPDEWGAPGFDMLALESRVGLDRHSAIGVPGVPTGHASILSEFGWLWCTRGGEPGLYLLNTYHKLPYPTDTPEERLETWNYILAGLVEYWRAHRNQAQVMHNAWLAGDMGPGHCAVCDNYKNPRTLEFQPAFMKYVKEAYKPLGVYLEFWKREVQAGESRIFYVMMVNDHLENKKGNVTVRFEYEDGTVIDMGSKAANLAANGSQTVRYEITVPEKIGKTMMTATIETEDGLKTVSQRWVEVKAEIPPRPYGQY